MAKGKRREAGVEKRDGKYWRKRRAEIDRLRGLKRRIAIESLGRDEVTVRKVEPGLSLAEMRRRADQGRKAER